jgi:hypothetical protein
LKKDTSDNSKDMRIKIPFNGNKLFKRPELFPTAHLSEFLTTPDIENLRNDWSFIKAAVEFQSRF